MGTSGPDLLVIAYRALAPDERDDAFERIHQLRVEEQAGTESEMAKFIRSIRRVSELLGHAPTADEYRALQPGLAAAGEDVESFSRIYGFLAPGRELRLLGASSRDGGPLAHDYGAAHRSAVSRAATRQRLALRRGRPARSA